MDQAKHSKPEDIHPSLATALFMESIEDYLQDLDLPHSYEVYGDQKPLEEFDGVAVPQNESKVFLGWNLHREDGAYHAVLSEDTPGLVKQLELEELEAKLLTGEYKPAIRTETGYQQAKIK